MKSFLINRIKDIQNARILSKHKGKNIRFLKNVRIDAKCVFEAWVSIGESNKLSNCQIGTGSYTGRNVEFGSVKVGRFCSIGSFVRNTGGRHPLSRFVSTHPAFFSTGKAAGFTFGREQKFEEFRYATPPFWVEIGNDVWVGDNVTILDGIKIGDGAVIGANALVTKDIEPYSINVGIPAKKIASRFNQSEIDFLLDVKWWNRDFEWIRDNFNMFDDIEKLRSAL
ncbi:CatB-related O-acetyltransferase [Terrimonas ginsenosidimutans]|uniref:CatB-related O-acetyltransferase n=1 Tax=Terrimonas ginsenosidimutans TaxID=2908004 RepID=UPI003D79E509